METTNPPHEAAPDDAGLRDRILDTAVALAERSDWESVRLHEVARELDIDLDQIRGYFREKDEMIDAWYDRADGAALAATRAPGFDALPPRERLETVIMAWLDHLAPHRRVARQMIGAKAEIGHIHIQIPAIMRISRTVQWFREAAGCNDALPRRAFVEAAHTAIYLTTFGRWLFDESSGSEHSRHLLHQLLERTAFTLP